MPILAPLASFAIRAVLPFLALFLAYALGYISGKATEHTHSLAALTAQSVQYESQRLRDTAAALAAQAALTQHADQLSRQLAEKSTQRGLRTRTLIQEISHAVLAPRLSPCPADLLCLDDHELQLYRAALGYPDPADLPAPTGQSDPIAPHAAATGSGLRLSPADLLYHAADYGEWCAQRDDQARTLAALYAPPIPATPAEQSHD